ncbi:MAG: hypothetical protein RQ966_17845 [Acetobacteraceae bacterium]|nr:hypothetical protein [Acetobacteraceae bacterium]
MSGPGERSPDLDCDLDRVHHLIRDREALRPAFTVAWCILSRADPALQGDWAAATLELVHVSAGVACIDAFWRLDPPDPAAGHAAAELCRHAGARAALACLEELPVARRLVGTAGLTLWWQAMGRLAREAPGLVRPVTKRLPHLLAAGDAAAFLDFVAAGLKATATDKRRRTAFFTGQDGLADALLARPAGAIGFAETSRMLNAFIGGLWGGAPRLRAFPPAPAGVSTRTAIASGTVVMPAIYPGIAPERSGLLYRAAAAHAQAHRVAPRPVLPVGSLRPIQRVLVGLIEDARVETLAIARFPGLRALWSPWHTAGPTGGGRVLAVQLLARLARALLDPAYADPDAFVRKGRALFAAADPHDPAISRAIGGLLGNDLGQMRVQINAKTYVVEPLYRDDNMHLWELPETQDDSLALSVDAARPAPDPAPAPRARDAGQDDRAAILATYPEWDNAARVLRPDWVTVRDVAPRVGPALPDPPRQRDLARLVRSVRVGARRRRPPREDGEELDLDRAIDAVAARRRRRTPDLRLYRDCAHAGRDLATLLIMDASHSTADRVSAGMTVLDTQRHAFAALATALHDRGDRFALRSFASDGRDDVRVTRLKDFDEPFGPVVGERLAGLRAGLSTRLGAALRHAGTEIAEQPTLRKLVLVATDGEPSDIDVPDSAELVEDARRAVLALRGRGIDVFGLIIRPGEADAGLTIFGRHNAMIVGGLDDLAPRLRAVYFRLAQR